MQRTDPLLILDTLLSCRLPATKTQIMFSTNTIYKKTERFLQTCIDRGLIECKENVHRVSGATRHQRMKKGWDFLKARDTPTEFGRYWYKTTQKGEEYISKFKKVWNSFNKDPTYKGILSYDTIGSDRRGGISSLVCPVMRRGYPHLGGFDPEWALKPSNAPIFVNEQKLISKVSLSPRKHF